MDVFNKAYSLSSKMQDVIEYVSDRKGHDKRYAIDNKKIIKNLTTFSLADLEKSINHTFNWYFHKFKVESSEKNMQ